MCFCKALVLSLRNKQKPHADLFYLACPLPNINGGGAIAAIIRNWHQVRHSPDTIGLGCSCPRCHRPSGCFPPPKYCQHGQVLAAFRPSSLFSETLTKAGSRVRWLQEHINLPLGGEGGDERIAEQWLSHLLILFLKPTQRHFAASRASKS